MILLLTEASLCQAFHSLKTWAEQRKSSVREGEIPFLPKLSGNILRKIKEKPERRRRAKEITVAKATFLFLFQSPFQHAPGKIITKAVYF